MTFRSSRLEKNDVASDRILPASWRQYSARRLANSASKVGSGFRLRGDEILGCFPILRKCTMQHMSAQGQKEFLNSKNCFARIQTCSGSEIRRSGLGNLFSRITC